jgi:uncharacterized protein
VLDPHTGAGRSAPDPNVLRAINAHADHCLGVYPTVEQDGTLAEGEALEFEPPPKPSAATTFARARATGLKRGALRVFDAMMPRGK